MQMLLEPVILTTGIALTVTAGVGVDTQPVVVFVKVKVAVPAERPETTPAFVTVATTGLLVDQVPPEVGDNDVVEPAQIAVAPVMPATGKAFTVTGSVEAEVQPVIALVKMKVAVPADTPVTTPVLVTVATPGLLLAQVPPVVGDSVVVKPAQILLVPVMLTTGKALTVTVPVGADTQPVVVFVKVKVAVPADTPVTIPPLVTVATPGALLTQVPPLVGDKVVVAPAQIVVEPVILTTGIALIVTAVVGADTQPVVPSVNVNVAMPADTPVTTPAFVTVATAGVLLVQVPPVEGDKVVVAPTQMLLAPIRLAIGVAFTVTAGVAAETQPVVELVKIKVTEPAATPVTRPAFVTVATPGLVLVQVPPVVGDKDVVPPMQMLNDPVTLTAGVGFTVIVPVGADAQPVAVLVKVKVAVPADTAVTTPELVTVATAALLLAQVPPVEGDRPVV
jgi:hypothetical protein